MLRGLLCPCAHDASVARLGAEEERPDVIAEIRGGDVKQGLDGELDIATSSFEQAVFWRDIYREILTMEESVMAGVVELMAVQSAITRREIELSNVPVIAAQLAQGRLQLAGDLRVEVWRGLAPVPWEADGRRGSAVVVGERCDGFAMMRDRERRLIAFHSMPADFQIGASNIAPSGTSQFTIHESDFRPYVDRHSRSLEARAEGT